MTRPTDRLDDRLDPLRLVTDDGPSTRSTSSRSAAAAFARRPSGGPSDPDEDARREMARALVTALEAAGIDEDLATSRAPPTSAELARETHAKLQYDFPIVTARELDALAEEVRRDLNGEGFKGAGAPGGAGAGRYPITERLVAAVVEGACKPPQGGTTAGPATSIAAAAAGSEATPEKSGGELGDAAASAVVRCAYQRLAAAVLVHFPRHVVRLNDADADAALGAYRCHVDVPAEHEQCSAVDEADAAASSAEALASPGPAPEPTSSDTSSDGGDADSDSDWEPLEGNPAVPPGGGWPGAGIDEAAADPLSTMDPADRVDAKLADLLGRARHACFDAVDALDASAGIRTSDPGSGPGPTGAGARALGRAEAVWDAWGVTGAATDLVEALARAESRPRRRAMRSTPLRLLRERFAAAGPPGAGDRDRDAVPRVLAALRFGSFETRAGGGGFGGGGLGDATAPGGDEDEGFALDFMAYLCVRLGGAALGDAALGDVAGDVATGLSGFGGGAAGALWPHAKASLRVVAERLERLAERANERGVVADPAWQQRAAACSLIAAFFVAFAPGNAKVGDALMTTGTTRAACALFAAPGMAEAPHAEALRRLMLLAAAAAPEAAAYISAVPNVRRILDASPAFQSGGALAAHGALWALVTSRGAAEAEAACADRLAPLLGVHVSGDGDDVVADVDGSAAVHAVGLLRAVQRAAQKSVGAAPLWSSGGGVEAVLRAGAAGAARAVAAGARARGDLPTRATRKATDSDDEGEREGGDDVAADVAAVVAAAAAGGETAAVAAAGLAGAMGAEGPVEGPGGGRKDEGSGGRAASASEPEIEKSRELAAAALRVLKEILGAADGGAGTRKCD